MRIINEKGYDFDDLLLIPRPSSVVSRQDVSLRTFLSDDFYLDVPIIASPMKGIISPELIIKLSRLGAIGIMHRFYSTISEWEDDAITVTQNAENFGVAIGLGDKQRLSQALDLGARIICIDVANGYTENVLDFCIEIADEVHNANALLMAGNVATDNGAIDLKAAGVDLIRVGIGPGGLCTTRNVTGVGVPQLTAIDMISDYKKAYDYRVIADGGIRNSGDIVKALSVGADAVMIGSMFAKTFESSHNGIIYGMASRKLQDEYYHGVKSVEGLEKETKQSMFVDELINELSWGIRSACTYLGASNLNELYNNATFIEVGKGSIKNLS